MRHVFLVFFFLLCGPSSDAQNKYNFNQFGNETWSFVKQPITWEGSDWLKLGLMGAGTFLVMYTADQPIRDAALRDWRYYKSIPIEGGRVWGEIYTPVFLFSGFAITALAIRDTTAKKIAYEIGQASLYAATITFTMKYVLGRARPYTNEGPKTFHPFTFADDGFHSLPSGHVTIAFVLSTVLSRNMKSVWLKGLVYVPAAFTVVSRVYQDKHWSSDGFLAAAIGYFVATWVVDQHEQGESRVSMSSIYPFTIRIALP